MPRLKALLFGLMGSGCTITGSRSVADNEFAARAVKLVTTYLRQKDMLFCKENILKEFYVGFGSTESCAILALGRFNAIRKHNLRSGHAQRLGHFFGERT